MYTVGSHMCEYVYSGHMCEYVYLAPRCLHIYTSTHLYIYVSIHIYTSIYLYIYTSIHPLIYLYIDVYICSSIYLYIYTSISIHLSIHLYIQVTMRTCRRNTRWSARRCTRSSVMKRSPTLKRQKPGVYHTYLNMHSCSPTCETRSQLCAICISMHTLIFAASVYLYTHLDVIPYDIALL